MLRFVSSMKHLIGASVRVYNIFYRDEGKLKPLIVKQSLLAKMVGEP
ncbi:hypothetical protein [Bartonella jaculi]